MRRDRMQQQRFELKYLIPEETALHIRDFVRSYLEMDEYSVGRPNYSYPVHSFYMREAYVSDNDEVRVTMDRTIQAEPNLAFSVKTEMKDPVRSFDKEVILELKFTNRYPEWFRELVRVFHVMQCGAAKYVESIQGIGHEKIGADIPVIEQPPRFSRAW